LLISLVDYRTEVILENVLKQLRLNGVTGEKMSRVEHSKDSRSKYG
jgi:hypothetical protein